MVRAVPGERSPYDYYWKRESEERVKVEGLVEVASEDRGEGTGRSTARALDVQERVNRAGRVEAVAIRWKAQAHGRCCKEEQGRGGTQRGSAVLSSHPRHD